MLNGVRGLRRELLSSKYRFNNILIIGNPYDIGIQ